MVDGDCPRNGGRLDMSYRFLMDLALILLSTKLLGLFTQKFQMPGARRNNYRRPPL